MTDEELVALYAAKEQLKHDAVGELIARYNDPLTRTIARRLKGDWNEAEDVVQKTWIKVLRHAETFDPRRSSFKKWLWWCSYNCFTDEYRRRRSKRVVTNWSRADDEEAAFEIADTREPAPDARSMQDELRARFWKFVSGVSEERRQALCLIFVERLTYREASEKCGVLATTLKKRVAAVLPALRHALGDIPLDANMELERRTDPRTDRLNPFYKLKRTSNDTFTIREFVETLAGEEFEVCQLVCYQGAEFGEASDELGLPEGTIHRILARVLHRMSQRVIGDGGEWLAAVA